MKHISTRVILLFFLAACTQAEEPVYFADPNLKAVVEDALWVLDPTPTDMLNLIVLDAEADEIESLVGLEFATNLRDLYLRYNRIRDLSPLAGLMNLESLVLHRTYLTDLSPLSGLTRLSFLDLNTTNITDISALSTLHNLTVLDVRNNQVSDISALSGLVNLEELIVERNEISDLSALLGLTRLSYLNLAYNSLSDEAYDVQIPRIIANNPGIDIYYDAKLLTVVISSSEGGSVIDPGEGVFTYPYIEWLRLEAKADPGYVFTAWTGTCYSTQNPMVITIEQNHEIFATFSLLAAESYVDDDAPDDPSPDDPGASDPIEDGTPDHPFDSIQEAIDAAADGQTVFVQPGTYRESITISRKSVHLIGRETSDPNGTDLPVIQADQKGRIVQINGNSTLSGFALTSGHGQNVLIDCSGGAAAISHCLIAGNRPAGAGGALIQCTAGNVTLTHCTIADNYLGECNAGLRVVNGILAMANSIFYHNTCTCSDAASGVICASADGRIVITYSDVEGGWSGVGNINADPLFVHQGQWMDAEDPFVLCDPTDPNTVWDMGDYHLLSQTGRWDPAAMSWLCDGATSPCIDAGDPAGSTGDEPSPNGGIVNLGVYGATTEASRGEASAGSP